MNSDYSKYKVEKKNDLNVFLRLENVFKDEVDKRVQDFFIKNITALTDRTKINESVYQESLEIRKIILSYLEGECVKKVEEFNRDPENFSYNYGWYENFSSRKRHEITHDELAHELCEIIRKIYFVYLENKFPENYKVSVKEISHEEMNDMSFQINE